MTRTRAFAAACTAILLCLPAPARAATAVASVNRICAGAAFDSRREARLTVSPMAVYSERRSEPM